MSSFRDTTRRAPRQQSSRRYDSVESDVPSIASLSDIEDNGFEEEKYHEDDIYDYLEKNRKPVHRKCEAELPGEFFKAEKRPKNTDIVELRRAVNWSLRNIAIDKLVKLNLSGTELDSSQFRSLARAMSNNQNCKKLEMRRCGISCKQILIFSHFLKCNRALTELQLSQNRIGDQGARTLASTLRYNVHLQTLSLDENPITELGIKALTKMMEDNRTILTLSVNDLCFCFLDMEVFERLNELLHENRALYEARKKVLKERKLKNSRLKKKKEKAESSKMKKKKYPQEDLNEQKKGTGLAQMVKKTMGNVKWRSMKERRGSGKENQNFNRRRLSANR